ncbi:hypothetical protein V2A60_009317 [Cordyceps javanica]
MHPSAMADPGADHIMQYADFVAPQSSNRGATPTAPFSRHLPSSTPEMPALSTSDDRGDPEALTLKPCDAYIDAIQLTKQQLDIVTCGKAQNPIHYTGNWEYKYRQNTHRILDYMYIGPTSAISHLNLKSDQFTLILLLRHTRSQTLTLQSVDRACQACPGLESHVEYSTDLWDLTRKFREIIQTLNTHMLAVHARAGTDAATAGGHAVPTGKILVTCDTGNDWSAAVVAAYIMAVFGVSRPQAVQFVSAQRFSCTFDDDVKARLDTWEGLLEAAGDVAEHRAATQHMQQPENSKHGKRAIDDSTSADVEMEDDGVCIGDEARFEDRKAFAPFKDIQ